MRKCKGSKMVNSDGKWVTKEFEGVFRGWGGDGEEIGDNILNSSCAIVEDESGLVHLLYADGLQFLED